MMPVLEMFATQERILTRNGLSVVEKVRDCGSGISDSCGLLRAKEPPFVLNFKSPDG